jgi:hypothetical protein
MAYKLPQLIKENYDFSNLVPTEQAEVQNKLSVAFNLSDIVTYIQKGTNNFRVENPIAVDLDNEIYKIAIDKGQGQGQPEPKGEEPPMPKEVEVEDIIVSDAAKDMYPPETIQEWLDTIESLNDLLKTKDEFGEAEVTEWEETVQSLKELLNS